MEKMIQTNCVPSNFRVAPRLECFSKVIKTLAINQKSREISQEIISHKSQFHVYQKSLKRQSVDCVMKSVWFSDVFFPNSQIIIQSKAPSEKRAFSGER